jgi:hypothetical protein
MLTSNNKKKLFDPPQEEFSFAKMKGLSKIQENVEPAHAQQLQKAVQHVHVHQLAECAWRWTGRLVTAPLCN